MHGNRPVTDCPLKKLDSGDWHCPVCDPNKKRLLPVNAHRNCQGEGYEPPHQQPPTTEDLAPAAERLGITPEHVAHYAQALAKWTAAGFPTRTQAEVEACLLICRGDSCREPCGEYAFGRCRKCGCCVNKSKVAVVNKVKMRTEVCPMGLWL